MSLLCSILAVIPLTVAIYYILSTLITNHISFDFSSSHIFSNSISKDHAWNYQLGFQDPGTPGMEEIVNFHNYVMIYLCFIICAILWLMYDIITSYNSTVKVISHKYLIHGTWLEIVWTITPAIILIFIAFPSFKLIYLLDEVIDAGITVKAIGHQWYWSYEFSDYYTLAGKNVEFDSYMIPESDIAKGQLRLLEVDNRLVLPLNTNIRMIITSADVLHCWAVPSLGVKLDAVPGRLNQLGFLLNRQSLYYGQCSEICGANHAFMPIVIDAVDIRSYYGYMSYQQK